MQKTIKNDKQYSKMLDKFKVETLDMLKNICDYIEDRMDVHIKTQMYVQEEQGYYRIYFSYNNQDWKCVDDISNRFSADDVYNNFKEKASAFTYRAENPPIAESVDNLSAITDIDEFLEKAIYSKEWILNYSKRRN